MPYRKKEAPEKLYTPGEADDSNDVDKYIDDLEGYTLEDLKSLDDEEEELSIEELRDKMLAGEDMEEFDAASVFTEYEYLSVPKIPDQYKASDVIGKRTQASGRGEIPMGAIRPKNRLRDIWNGLTDLDKYILMLISEHRHMTLAQLGTLIITPSRARMKKGAVNNTKTYFEWVTERKYGVEDMVYKDTFKLKKMTGLQRKIDALCKAGLLEEILPAYGMKEDNASARYVETPALFTHHYYLTPLGAKVLVCNTKANNNKSKVNPVGYVPSYKHAAFQSVLHEAESTEILCSIISCASYATNPDIDLESGESGTVESYGLFDICRFYHEKDIEEKVEYRGKKTKFKTDGKLTMYVESIGDFIDWYIEYDAGSSTVDKITHKTEAFIKYVFDKRKKYGERFRKPVLLLVTQKPADLFPQINGRKSTTYTTGIKNMAHANFEEYLDILNDIAIVLAADCGSIRQHGALGACWHKIDLTTGIAEMKAYDLITASCGMHRNADDSPAE